MNNTTTQLDAVISAAAEKLSCRTKKLSIAILALLALLFVIFTFHAPGIGLFRDPLTGGYGI